MKKAISALVIVLLVVPSLVFGFDTKTFQVIKSTKPVPYCIMAEGYPTEGHFATILTSASSDNGSQEVVNIANAMIGAYLKHNSYEETTLSYIFAGKRDLPIGTVPMGVFVHRDDVMNVDKINEAKELLKKTPHAGCPETAKIWKLTTNDCTYYVRYRFPLIKEKEASVAIIINGSNNCSAESLEEEANKIKEFMINYAREINRQNR